MALMHRDRAAALSRLPPRGRRASMHECACAMHVRVCVSVCCFPPTALPSLLRVKKKKDLTDVTGTWNFVHIDDKVTQSQLTEQPVVSDQLSRL